VPTGGTSDYGPEMLHAAAQGLNYECFVYPDSRIPFMVMPDAVKALIQVSEAKRESLKQRVYNVTAFAPSAKEIELEIKKYFPSFNVTYKIHQQRLNIVESWPENTNDSPAQRDWNWKADFNFEDAFKTYLVPAVKRRYEKSACLDNCANS
jgi:nucleoside-diphosphate-sugar epimerase